MIFFKLTRRAPNAIIGDLRKKSNLHQILPQFECLKEHKDKSLLSNF